MTNHIDEALRALADGDTGTAREAVRGGGTPLAAALAEHLAATRDGSVYDQPAAFEAFIGGGGNVGLYRAVSEALGRLYAEVEPAGLLDIGCGDGRALRPALASHAPASVTLVEPSAALLDAAVRALDGYDVDARRTRVEPFAAGLAEDVVFDVAQSTFALHTLPHEVRDRVLADLVGHVGVLAVVEFDVPDLAHGSPEHRRFLAEAYERGLAEYDDDRDLVAQGFLMPVLTGQLVPGATRATWEQPASRWAEQVERAGFTGVRVTRLHDYWWSPAFLLTASGSPTAATRP
ncbi:class I SAM-dependent methyltransferase [Saccharothrix sp. S26]|uniref:class I SAM-dependent methyltransferase n=1 Tax=Saccharothrix sp. S26 TaxID=2907215 RepID=UPI001F43A196|nr:class I SAM-dependent methyltransferase [Saccharothrix sp. S26]MCE6995211.1 class I SAM-dependent methyltransferase [Saccharothrix sp. S26]